MSGSVSKGGGKDSASRSLQMMERPLMTPDELKSIPKGQFVVMKTGTHPMQTRLRLFLDWGISFGDPYLLPERAARTVAYASKQELEQAIFRCQYAQLLKSWDCRSLSSNGRWMSCTRRSWYPRSIAGGRTGVSAQICTDCCSGKQSFTAKWLLRLGGEPRVGSWWAGLKGSL